MILKQIVICPYCDEHLDVQINLEDEHEEENRFMILTDDNGCGNDFLTIWAVDIDETGYKIQLETRAVRKQRKKNQS